MSMTRGEAISRFEVMADETFVTDMLYDTDNDIESVRDAHEISKIALQALREQEEREKQPQPLTMAELRKMNGETVYCLELNLDVKILAKKVGFVHVSYQFPGVYGECQAMDLTLYRARPEEDV